MSLMSHARAYAQCRSAVLRWRFRGPRRLPGSSCRRKNRSLTNSAFAGLARPVRSRASSKPGSSSGGRCDSICSSSISRRSPAPFHACGFSCGGHSPPEIRRIASAAAAKKCASAVPGCLAVLHQPAGCTPHAPTPWPGASGPAFPGPSWRPPASAVPRRPAAEAARRPRDRRLRLRQDAGDVGHGHCPFGAIASPNTRNGNAFVGTKRPIAQFTGAQRVRECMRHTREGVSTNRRGANAGGEPDP